VNKLREIFTISVSMDAEAYAKSKAIDEQTEWVAARGRASRLDPDARPRVPPDPL
jgi:hypothetical protein